MPDTTVPQGNADRLAPAMAEVKRLDPVDLLALYYLIWNTIPAAEFPRLILASRVVTDDGETYAQQYLECPHCHERIVTDDEDGDAVGLIAVDIAERWTDGATVSFEDHDVQWIYDGDSDFEGLLYKHACGLPVRLPEGWTER